MRAKPRPYDDKQEDPWLLLHHISVLSILRTTRLKLGRQALQQLACVDQQSSCLSLSIQGVPSPSRASFQQRLWPALGEDGLDTLSKRNWKHEAETRRNWQGQAYEEQFWFLNAQVGSLRYVNNYINFWIKILQGEMLLKWLVNSQMIWMMLWT